VRQWVSETAGGLPRPFWYLWTNTLINRLGSFAIIVLAIYLTQGRGFSESFAGLVIGLWGAGAAVGTLIGGVLADRWGRKPTALTALYGAAGVMLLVGFATGRLEIAIAVTVLGMVNEAARPALSALMIDIVGERDRVRAFSLNYWVINVGFAVAATLAGVLAGVDFRLLFAINAAAIVIGATIVAIGVTEPRRAPRPAATVTAGPGLRAVFTDRVYMSFTAVNVLLAIVFMQHISTLPMAMGHDGLPPATFGSVIALNGVLIVAGQLFIPRLLRGRRPSTTMAVAAVIVGVGFGLTAFADAAWFYGLTVLVWTIGEMLNSPSNSATNADLSPAHLRGRYQGVFSLSWSVASFVAPLLGAAVLQYAGSTVLWLGCFVVGLVVAGCHLAAGPARERRAAQIRAAEAGTGASVPAGDSTAVPAPSDVREPALTTT
jgi:MFS family permease